MTAKNLIKAVGYARRSTDLQERSLPDQRAYVERWAEENGYAIQRWYCDDAASGTSTKGREAFERMIREAENGPDFQAILCYDMSRFSRGGTNETGYYLHRLSLAGVEAVFCAEGIPEGEEGELLQGVKSWQARQYSVKLARDTIRGQISNILERRCAPGGTPPYGYDKQHVTAAGQVLRTFRWLPHGRKQEFSPEGKLVRVLEPGETVKKARSDIVRYVPSTPERIAVVRRIFEQSAAGYGSRHTAARLNDEGIPSVDGKKWNSNQVRRLLANPAYRGALAWNKRTLGKINGVGRDGKLRPRRGAYTQKQNPVEDWFVVEGVHEPLVSPEVFEKGQRAHRARRGQGGRAKTVNRALLSGLITCRHCGWHFGQWHTNYTFQGKRTRFRYYIDRGYHTGGKAVCKATFIPADALDAWVVGKVRDVLLGDAKTVEAAVDAFVKRVLGSRKPARDTAAVERDLDAVNRRIQATVAMLADPTFDGLEELKKTLADLKAKRDALQARLKREKVPADVPLREADLRAWARDRIRQIEKVLAGRMPTMEARRVVHAFVDRIEVDPHRRCGVLYLPADAASSFARETSTRGALGDLRAEMKTPEMPFVFAQISKAPAWDNPPSRGPQIRAAQLEVSKTVPHTATFATDDYKMCDPWHYDTAGMISLGERFAKAMKVLEESAAGEAPKTDEAKTALTAQRGPAPWTTKAARSWALTAGPNVRRTSADRAAAVACAPCDGRSAIHSQDGARSANSALADRLRSIRRWGSSRAARRSPSMATTCSRAT